MQFIFKDFQIKLVLCLKILVFNLELYNNYKFIINFIIILNLL